jgi:hypothetical protein
MQAHYAKKKSIAQLPIESRGLFDSFERLNCGRKGNISLTQLHGVSWSTFDEVNWQDNGLSG